MNSSANRARILIAGALVRVNGDNLVTSAGAVTEMVNQGLGGASYDLDVVVGTGANLKKSISDACLFYGASGDYASTPDSAAASILGDMDIRIRLALADWISGAFQTVIDKGNVSPTLAYRVIISDAGIPLLDISANGTSISRSAASVAPTVSDGDTIWLKITYAAAGDVNFYTSTDDTNDDTAVTWSQLGTADIANASASIFDSSASLIINGLNGTSENFAGSVYQAQIYNGIDGTLAVDFNAADYVNKDSDTTFDTVMGADIFVDPTLGDWVDNGDGSYTLTGDGSFQPILSDGAAVTGQTFTAEYTVDSISGGSLKFSSGSTTGGTASAPGDYKQTVVVDAGNKPGFARNVADTITVTISNITIRQVTPWTLNGDTFIQNTGHNVVHSIGSAGLETTAEQDITVFTAYFVARITTTPGADMFLFDAKSSAGKSVRVFTDESNSDKWTLDAGGTPIALSAALNNDWNVIVVEYSADSSSKLTVGPNSVTGDAGSEALGFATFFADLSAGNTATLAIADSLFYPYAHNQTQVADLKLLLAQDYRL